MNKSTMDKQTKAGTDFAGIAMRQPGELVESMKLKIKYIRDGTNMRIKDKKKR